MKIVHIITRLIVGGAQENTVLSCEGQHDRGHEVTLITGPPIGPEGSLLDRAKNYGYRVEIFDELRRSILPRKDWNTYKRLIARLKEINPDVVHTHSSKAGIIGRWAASKAKMPFIVHTIHGLAFTASTSRLINTFYEMLERKTAPLTHRIVCVAEEMKKQSLAAGVGTEEQYVTIYSGMETAPFLNPPVPREQARSQLGIQPDDIVAGTIARLFHLKGHDDLLDIATNLCSKFPNLKFLWVGEGILRSKFEQRVAEMGLKDRFILSGLVPPTQIPQIVNTMDILVHPSRREGLARALPQGSLAGIPVVTYDVDGNREGLIDGTTGFALPAFDKQKLSDTIALLASNPQIRSSMGQAGRRFAIERFDVKVMIDALDELYVAGKKES